MHSNVYLHRLGLVIVIVIVSGLAPRAVAATDPEAFRTAFLNDLSLLESISPPDPARQFADVKARISALTPAELAILQSTVPSG